MRTGAWRTSRKTEVDVVLVPVTSQRAEWDSATTLRGEAPALAPAPAPAPVGDWSLVDARVLCLCRLGTTTRCRGACMMTSVLAPPHKSGLGSAASGLMGWGAATSTAALGLPVTAPGVARGSGLDADILRGLRVPGDTMGTDSTLVGVSGESGRSTQSMNGRDTKCVSDCPSDTRSLEANTYTRSREGP